MEKKAVDSSEVTLECAAVGLAPLDEVCLDRRVGNQRQLASGEIASLCQITCPEDTSFNSAETSDVIEDVNMLQDVDTSQPSVERKGQDVLDCHDDNSLCISKDNIVAMATIDQTGDEDPMNVTPSAASVNSICLEVSERSSNDLSTPTGSFNNQLFAGGGDKCSSPQLKNSSESLLTTTDVSERSNPTETSVHRDGQDGAMTEKCVTFGCKKEQVELLVTNMITSNISQQNENHELLKPKTGFIDTNPPAADLSMSDGSESLKSNPPVANTQEPLLQSQVKFYGDGSDELVDVRVCDICGDGGREALLALCSTCSDGAEHIYCMRTKMDKVPERDWMCEDCIGMQEPKGHSQIVAGKAGSALTPSCVKESTHSLPRISPGVQQAGKMSSKNLSKALSFPGPGVQQAGKMGSKHLSKALSFPGKRPGSRVEVRSAPKKKTFQASVHSPESPCDGTKAQLPRISSLNYIHKGKSTSPQVPSMGGPAKRAFDQAFSSGDRSPKLKKRFCKGSLYQSKKDGMSELNIKVQQSKDILLRSVPAKESADIKMDKVPNKRLSKSLSIAGSVLPDVSIAPSSYISKSKSPRAVGGRDLTKKVYVSEKNTNRLGPSSTSSCSMKVRSCRTKLVPETATAVTFLDKTASGITKVRKTDILQEGKRRANISAGSVGEKMPSDPGHKGSQPTWKGGLNITAKDKKCHVVAPGKVLQHELRPEKPMPLFAPAKVVLSGSSAIPAAESFWKGGFQLERSGKVPNYCSGIQAHLSSCASSEVHEVVSKFGPKLLLKQTPRSETWPTYFRSHDPTEQDIALYFFAEDLQSYDRSFKMLLDSMIETDLVLEASLGGVELLVLPSSLLPVTSQRWNSLFFLWGVFKGRKVDHHSLHLPNSGVKSLKKKKRTCLTNGSVDKSVSLLEAGSPSGSQKSLSILEPEAVDSLLLLSTALVKSSDQSCKYDVPEQNNMHPDKIQTVHDPKEDTHPSRVLPAGDMLTGIQSDDRDITHISKTAIFPSGQANGESIFSSAENVRESGLHSDRSCRSLSVPWLYNCTSEFCSKQDFASRSSFSIDSGPSASSDGCAKSDEVHGEQLQRPSNSRGLNLDLCLGFSSDPDERIDLNLGLGFPSEYQPKHCTESTITRDMNISPVLSLGMPCSNA